MTGMRSTSRVRSAATSRTPRAQHNIPFCHEHDTKQLLDTTKSGRVKLDEDVCGLRTRHEHRQDRAERIKRSSTPVTSAACRSG